MFKFLTQVIIRTLAFSKTEARGTLLLIFIILAVFTISRIYVDILKNPTSAEYSDHEVYASWMAEVDAAYEIKSAEVTPGKRIHITENYPDKTQARSLDKPSESSPLVPSEVKEVIIVADLNTATMEDLQKVRGVGPAFSSRIVKYRSKLGGFARNDQLHEVYQLKEQTIDEILKYFKVQSRPELININSDSAKVLARHPYISYDLAWIIINFRKQNGNISSSEDLKNIKAINDETFLRLKPYLD